jgi:hypothetical protein
MAVVCRTVWGVIRRFSKPTLSLAAALTAIPRIKAFALLRQKASYLAKINAVTPSFAQHDLILRLVRCLIRAAKVVTLSRLAGPRLTPFSIKRGSPNKRTRVFALVTAV